MFSCTAEIFNFTKGRFVTNEQHELAQRHRTFNLRELAQHAAHAVKADRCLSIKKYPDDMDNRVLLLFMDNGKEVIAKIPNPNSMIVVPMSYRPSFDIQYPEIIFLCPASLTSLCSSHA
jgi:hypothetical protein